MEEFPPEPVDWHKRGCYCALWHEGPELLEKQNLPYGYCGWCGVCKKPGHTRHSPRGPFTGGWCDACWEKLLSEVRQGPITSSREGG